jgi:WD40 repeat protein
MYITGGGDGQLKLWGMNGNLIQVIDAYSNDTEPCTGDEVKCREDFGVVTAVSFSKDGNQILFGNGNGKIKTIYTIEGAMAKHEIYKTKVTSLNMQ